jgi:predicted AlkP superfamily pyrophosphatase or phosphodiesterase
LRSVDAVYRALHGTLPHLTIYKRQELPARYHYGEHPHTAPIVGIPDEGWIVTTREQEARRKPDAEGRRGAHGYDPALSAMHGLFVANGPSVREGLVVEPFENVHIYDFLCAILKITPAKNDGDARVARSFLKQP